MGRTLRCTTTKHGRARPRAALGLVVMAKTATHGARGQGSAPPWRPTLRAASLRTVRGAWHLGSLREQSQAGRAGNADAGAGLRTLPRTLLVSGSHAPRRAVLAEGDHRPCLLRPQRPLARRGPVRWRAVPCRERTSCARSKREKPAPPVVNTGLSGPEIGESQLSASSTPDKVR